MTKTSKLIVGLVGIALVIGAIFLTQRNTEGEKVVIGASFALTGKSPISERLSATEA
ncbi:MAG: hypothetical protein UT41_C0002G0039 [Candidatus Wolfebacteria bacterium GW2011_GWC2_39_22]|uniref:Uncharacterized protein n=1 Tax=Candidatus Wolfebacteria bacterium GW2011_GWC2_39_22 TaxID=1619013 RepID=A0A0G0QPE1_9BACT|nr:MAG: hypothetical protein UT41_C0002G0039 [Candidatus Wolfebacteria bacterium GW2011_GWC2_39_22]